MSWRHAVLRLEGATWLPEDTGSTNGTFVGVQRVQRVAAVFSFITYRRLKGRSPGRR